jgi:Ca2+/Na+ antiporter
VLAAAAANSTKLTDTEIGAVAGLTAFSLFIVMALIAYLLFKQSWADIRDSGVFTVAAQVTFSLIVICVVTLLMFGGVVSAEAGLPILAGIAGVIVGKSRTTAVVAAAAGGQPQQGGAPQQGGGPQQAPAPPVSAPQ